MGTLMAILILAGISQGLCRTTYATAPAAPTGLFLDGTILRWDASSGLSSYSVEMYKAYAKIASVETSNTWYNFVATLEEYGSYQYTFVVTVKNGDGENSSTLEAFYKKPGEIEVTSLSAFITTPVANQKPDVHPVSGDSSKYTVKIFYNMILNNYHWFKGGDLGAPGPIMEDGEVFQAGGDYIVEISFTAKEGYAIHDDPNKVTLNGITGSRVSTGNGSVSYRFAFYNCGTIADGFAYVDGAWGYYKDQKLQTGLTGLVKGTISGEEAWWYVVNGRPNFSKTGIVSGTVDGATGLWYVSGGKVVKDSGWKDLGDGWYYFQPASGSVASGWLPYNGEWYYMDPSSGKLQTGWVPYEDYYIYCDPYHTGWIYYYGKTYYYNLSTASWKTGWLDWRGYWYYLYPSNYSLATGWVPYDGYYIYCDPYHTGWIYNNGKFYYYDLKNNKWKTGWFEWKGTWYYFDPYTLAMQ